LWLPTLKAFRSKFSGEIKYLTFAGPQGHDLELFAIQQKLIRIENIRIWENSPDVAQRLVQKYGPTLNIKQGEAFDLCKAKNEKSFFPFHVVNLDYTSGAFYVDQPRQLPTKLETVQVIINNQEEHATSFLLFLAVAAKADVDSDFGRLFVQKAAFDLAKRLGKTEPLFNLTRDLAKTYSETLATIVPCIVIRMGGEHHFDTQCIGKAVYRPYRSTKTTILSFVFSLEYDHVALTLSNHQNMKLFDASIEDRQREACALQLIDVNLKIPKRRPSKTTARRSR
jgi:hypothetical protein